MVEVRGRRVRPAYVERALATIAGVREAVVTVVSDGHGGTRLVAHAARRPMVRSLLDHTGVSAETDAAISGFAWALARQRLAIDASRGRPLMRDVYRFDPDAKRRLQVVGAAVPGAPWMLRSLYRARSRVVRNGFHP